MQFKEKTREKLKVLTFLDVNPGEGFVYCGSRFMKLEKPHKRKDLKSRPYIAVWLEKYSGTLCRFPDSEPITRILGPLTEE